eukprot:365981-Chlamydomonas_euryale.AAC.25
MVRRRRRPRREGVHGAYHGSAYRRFRAAQPQLQPADLAGGRRGAAEAGGVLGGPAKGLADAGLDWQA